LKPLKLFILGLAVAIAGGSLPQQAKANDADDIVAYTNYVRAQYGLEPLTVNAALSNAALYHAQNMASQYCMSHVLDGLDGGDRLRAFGYEWTCWAENIASNYGYDDPAQEAMVAWINSPRHLQNILDPNVTEIGVGIAVSEDGTIFDCQNFGSR